MIVKISDAVRVGWYRGRVTLRERSRHYLALMLLIGMLGGLAMGAVIVARRTQSSFSRYVTSTNPSRLTATTFTNGSYDPAVVSQIRRLGAIAQVETVAGLDIAPLGSNGLPRSADVNADGKILWYGSVDSLYFDQDRVTAVEGRLPDPTRADEVVMTRDASQLLHVQVGDRLPVGVYANGSRGLSRLGVAAPSPHARISVTVVGLVVFNDGVVRDDAFKFPTYVLFTPAFTRPLVRCCSFYTVSGIRFGSPSPTAIETAIERALPKGSTFYFRDIAVVHAQVERAVRPLAIALGVFGAIAAIAGLVIVGQMIGSQLRSRSNELFVLRALGADTVTRSVDGLIGVVGAIVAGSFLAVGVAVGLSSAAPLGPIRAVDPGVGATFDPTVLFVGMATLIVGLTTVAMVHGYRVAQQTADHRVAQADVKTGVPRTVAAVLPLAWNQGIRFAVYRDRRGGEPAPTRSAITSTAITVLLMVATLVFGASLTTLVSHPPLYGWNWDYELSSRFGGSGNIPQQHAANLLDHDRNVAAWTGVYFDTMRVDVLTVPILGMTPRAPVSPPVLSGHAMDAPDQIVLGAQTLAQLHKHLGDTVEVRYATVAAPTRLRIVGTATMPAIGPGGGLHLSMGNGAIVNDQLIPPAIRNGGGTATGPNAIFVRLRNDARSPAALRSIQRLAATLNSPSNGQVSALATQRPAEIVNYRSMGATPAGLAAALATAAAIALALSLASSVRSRRRDLALLKALGLSRRQVAAIVASQSTTVVFAGTIAGVPLGILLGRSLWNLFAHSLHVVPVADVPVTSIALVAIGAVLLANLIAAVPGHRAARTPVSVLLHAE